MNMETHHLSLVVESSYADLVINAGKVTFGEENRKKLQKTQRDQEKAKVSQAACALLNSGGGVVLMEMANNDEHPVELGLDLEESLRTLIQSSDLQTFFETKQEGRRFYLFVKSWRPDPSSEDDAIKPRICSLGSSLYRRSGTSVLLMKPREALNFLKDKEKKTKFLENEPPNKILKQSKQDSRTLTPAEQTFQRDQLQRGEILPFPESPSVEFKQFSTKHIQQYVKNIVPEYISAFANTGNGYLFIGVDDKSKKVLGCAKENFDRDSLSEIIEDAINKLICVHFCQSRCQITFTLKFMDVLEEGQVYGHVCAIRVQRFCCAVFSEAPKSWLVRDGKVCRLTTKEWVDMVMYRDPDLECLSKDFESQLSLSSGPPQCRPVYSKKGLEHKKDLQQLLFPVPSEGVQYKPESLWRELSSEHKGLKKLINKQMHPLSLGVLVFSRSWAADLNLSKKPEVICDVLLVTQDSVPILYTVLRGQDANGQQYCTCIASTLKQKLVNTGGYTGRLYVMPRVLQLSPESHAEPSEGSGSLTDYPESYHLADTQQMTTLLQSLVVVLLGFRSFLSDQVGCEILNLLTAQQYKIISKNLHKTRELFIHGSPGTGKTIIAMKIMEKIKNMFGCEENEILYVCENQPLRDFIGNKNICYAVTRKTFMRTDFKNVKHIIIDEAQNFRTEDGDWYKKAKTITQTGRDNLGILWIFLDYFQTSHGAESGLPSLRDQDPREELTKVVRNADQIAIYLQERMDVVRENPPPNIPAGSLKMLSQTEWVQGVPGKCKIKRLLNLDQLVAYITRKCQFFLKQGYSCKDIAMLCSTASDIEKYKSMLQTAMRKRKSSESSEEADLIRFRNASEVTGNHIVLDSVRRFSGLERNIVFGINPRAAEPAVFNNLLLCLASRARKRLYILMLIKES